MLQPKRVGLDRPIAVAHKKIFAFLLRVNEERRIHATLRVAGGWVRDALLGLHSQDIDIAIESPESRHISGEVFAREVSAFQEAIGLTARTVSVIRVNPELSKHIETATVCVYDTPIEFCALRHDEYTKSDSRIPVVRPATPLEDAQRRDYTINALFYNLHTMEVEDYTTGLEDLQRRILRCPLNPRETFSDDPLRLLRGVRFIGQLGELNFTLDESITQCVDEELLGKITLKVSRERIGKEVTKMLSGPFPEKCVELLFNLGILQRVLLAELYVKSSKKGHVTAEVERIEYLALTGITSKDNLECLCLLNSTLAPLFSMSGSPLKLSLSSSEKIIAMLFILCLPFYRGVFSDELADRLYALCLNGLKLPLAYYNTLKRMMDAYNRLLIQKLNISCILEQGIKMEVKNTIFEGLCDLNDKKIFPSAFKIVLSAYILIEEKKDLLYSKNVEMTSDFISKIWNILEQESGLLDAVSRHLPLKGNELSTLVPLDPQYIGPALLALRRYMMFHPNASKDEMILWLRNEKDRLLNK
ncbi:tRNA nucleotidyltransferase/poly(A) polymerase [Trypanosoma melophagium]|uniref:tRNA nucleotidyltransferase/poly(A) polymerase n=1 Tax=Trypanosoma melophagium TaxID=715481 RepID=UPI00351A54BA|nr:tRNA nucleotidyltransferase/poly(A) polymerase [Trypanosoma melophagium]